MWVVEFSEFNKKDKICNRLLLLILLCEIHILKSICIKTTDKEKYKNNKNSNIILSIYTPDLTAVWLIGNDVIEMPHCHLCEYNVII